MITRRAFLGVLGVTAAIPAAVISSGPYNYFTPPAFPPELEPTDIEVDPHADGMDLPYATRLLHRRILSYLGPLYTLTAARREQVWIGTRSAGGTFDRLVSAYVPEVDARTGTLEIDRRFVDGMAKDMAAKIRENRFRYTGQLELPQGVSAAVNVINKRLALRGVSIFNIVTMRHEVRFDILGARG